ncbi:T9SS type A sorting domain-containing protein [bacterium]|nr:T9SS type A sorting domain-containing protein [bacterium]
MRIHHNVFASIYNDNPVLRTGPNFHGSLDSNWIEGNSGDCFFDAIPPADSIHAENNWWGDVSGPYHSALNPNGLGDTLGYGLVDFVPWLTSPPDTSWSVVSPTRPHIPSTWALLNVFPNPFNSEIRIEIAGFARNGFSIKLYNLLGREVAVLHDGPLTGNSLSFVAPPGLASGVYLLRASDKTSSSTRKVILLK